MKKSSPPKKSAPTRKNSKRRPGPQSGAKKSTQPVVRKTADSQPSLLLDESIRLSKLMSERGLCSRREADRFIEKGLVEVNGEVINELGTKVTRRDSVRLLEQALAHQDKLLTIIINKPIGYVSSQPEDGYKAAMELILPGNCFGDEKYSWKDSRCIGLAPAGRLDIDSKGLLILTQDGRLAKKIIGENSEIEKEYLVRIDRKLSEEEIDLLREGLELDGKKLKRAEVEVLNKDQLKMVLREGKKRQIRRMIELVGAKVTGLKRVRIGQLKLGQLPEGQWRLLEPDETV